MIRILIPVVAFPEEDQMVEPQFPFELPVTAAPGEAVLTAEMVVYYCNYASVEVCLIDEVQIEVPIITQGEAERFVLSYQVEVPEDFEAL
jgi:hypothetical protein